LSLAVRRFSGSGGVPVWGVSVPCAVVPGSPAVSSPAPSLPRGQVWVSGV
jgi:hypothetical protein